MGLNRLSTETSRSGPRPPFITSTLNRLRTPSRAIINASRLCPSPPKTALAKPSTGSSPTPAGSSSPAIRTKYPCPLLALTFYIGLDLEVQDVHHFVDGRTAVRRNPTSRRSASRRGRPRGTH